MKQLCAYPGCGNTFEPKRSDARFCSDTCRAKASKDRQRAGRLPVPATAAASARPTAPRPPAAAHMPEDRFARYPPTGDYRPGESDALPVTVEGRLARLEEHQRELEEDFDGEAKERKAWNKLRPAIEAALAGKAGGTSGGLTADQVIGVLRVEFGPLAAPLRKRLDAIEATHAGVRADIEKLSRAADGGQGARPRADDLAQQLRGLRKRVKAVEREIRAFGAGVSEIIDEVGGADDDE